MRLLTWNSHQELILTKILDGHPVPPYAILSHTWGADSDEVDYADIQQGRARSKKGYKKIQFCCKQAQRDRIRHFWIDTCCINKADCAELSESINSMYRWYRDAEKCYVYLSDVPAYHNDHKNDTFSAWEAILRTSRWFTRGWTLQELLAPKVVEFFSHDGVLLGTKTTLAEQIHDITALPLSALYGTPPSQFSIAERWKWVQARKTSKTEDRAYCLFGIFDVFMPLIYGEGDHAFLRLEKAVEDRSKVNICDMLSVSDGYSNKSPSPLLRSTLMHQLCDDNESSERSPKRCKIDHYETNSLQNDRRVSQDCMYKSRDDYDSLLKSLLFDRISFRVNNVKKALLSTGEWLLDDPRFQSWLRNDTSSQHNGFFWIKGKPGCGKSTLMKAALEWARKRHAHNHIQQTIVPYFFNARAADSLEKSAMGLYRTIVYHLLSTCKALKSLFMNSFALKDPGMSGENWTAEELQEFLFDAVESHVAFGLCLFIDALDEAEFESDVRQMISFLIQLSDRAIAAGGSCQLQICLSSRHYPHISIGRGLCLVVEDEPKHGHDIETYINKQLTCHDGPEKDILRVSILNKSARVFLWVVIVVDMLNKLDDDGTPLSDMQARIETVPAGLNDLFREILLKSHHGMETAVLFFQWMVFSIRPLEPAELYVAIEYSRKSSDPAWMPPRTVIPPFDRLARYILNCSHGLVEVVGTAPGQPPVVQFIHETVREFLVRDNGLISIVPNLTKNLVGISHEILRVACLRCVTANTMSDEYQHYYEAVNETNFSWRIFESGMRRRSPFLDYSIMYLLEHSEHAQRHSISQQAFLKTQMNRDGVWSDAPRLWWNVLERDKTRKIASGVTLLYFVVTRRYFSLVPVVLNLADAVNKGPRYHETVLQLASVEGSLWLVQLLLEAGAAVNTLGGKYNTALQAASVGGHKNVVQVLLGAGAEVHPQGGYYGTALQAASSRGHEKTLQLLLQAGADVNAQGGKYGTALQAASSHGHAKVLQLLLEAGAEVNAHQGLFGNALYKASERGHEKIVQLLVEAGAEVDAQGGYYGTALQAASTKGQEKIVKTLLRAGAEVNAQSGFWDNALHAASARGHEKVVQILKQAGARWRERSCDST